MMEKRKKIKWEQKRYVDPLPQYLNFKDTQKEGFLKHCEKMAVKIPCPFTPHCFLRATILTLYSIDTHFNPFPNKRWFLRVCSTNLLKTLWEKEKLLLTSNFSFSHTVFYPLEELFAISVKFEIVICKHFQLGRV